MVKLTKGNVDAVQTSGKVRGTTGVDALIENANANVNADYTALATANISSMEHDLLFICLD